MDYEMKFIEELKAKIDEYNAELGKTREEFEADYKEETGKDYDADYYYASLSGKAIAYITSLKCMVDAFIGVYGKEVTE